MDNQSEIAIQIYDRKKLKKKDQGFLGLVTFKVSSVFDIDRGGNGTSFFFDF